MKLGLITDARRWRRNILRHPCPSCNAQPGQPCNIENPHLARQFHYTREYAARKTPKCLTPQS